MNKKVLIISIILFLAIAMIAGVLFFLSQKEKGVEQEIIQGKILQDLNEQKIVDEVKNAFYDKFPEWPHDIMNFKIDLIDGSNAIGRMNHGGSKYIWFASSLKGRWEIVNYGVDYFGQCQDFVNYDFPENMTPDCWDGTTYEFIDTSNPDFFYPKGFSIEDKSSILDAFMVFANEKKLDTYYKSKTLYLKIDSLDGDYFKGMVIIGGGENRSNPYILAVKNNEQWKVIFQGQDYPECGLVEDYNFPKKIVPICIRKGIEQTNNIQIEDKVLLEDTSDWKIYNNSKAGFEIKYPKDLIIASSSSDTNIIFSNNNEGHWIYNVRISENSDNSSLDKILSDVLKEARSESFDVSDISINGIRAKRFLIKDGHDYGNLGVIFVCESNIVYIFGDNDGIFGGRIFETFYNSLNVK